MDFNKIPDEVANDEWLNQLWEKMVLPGLIDFDDAKALVESLKPPSESAIADLIESSEEKSIIEMRIALEEAESLVQQLTEHLESWAKETLSVSLSADQRLTATQAFNRTKSQLKSNIEAMKIQAVKYELTEAVEFVDQIMNYVSPPTQSRVRSVSTSEERAWLKEHGHDVSDRGRIPAALHELWLSRDE